MLRSFKYSTLQYQIVFQVAGSSHIFKHVKTRICPLEYVCRVTARCVSSWFTQQCIPKLCLSHITRFSGFRQRFARQQHLRWRSSEYHPVSDSVLSRENPWPTMSLVKSSWLWLTNLPLKGSRCMLYCGQQDFLTWLAKSGWDPYHLPEEMENKLSRSYFCVIG